MHPNPSDRMAAIEWPREMLASDCYILDCETTSRYPAEAEIVQIAIIDHEARTRLDMLLKPTQPIPDDVVAIHGITNEAVADAPTFAWAWPIIEHILCDSPLVIYNRSYDLPVITANVGRHNLLCSREIVASCAMLQYAAFVGDIGRFGSYRWHKLPVAPGETAHGAVSDCRSTLHLMKAMAEAES